MKAPPPPVAQTLDPLERIRSAVWLLRVEALAANPRAESIAYLKSQGMTDEEIALVESTLRTKGV